MNQQHLPTHRNFEVRTLRGSFLWGSRYVLLSMIKCEIRLEHNKQIHQRSQKIVLTMLKQLGDVNHKLYPHWYRNLAGWRLTTRKYFLEERFCGIERFSFYLVHSRNKKERMRKLILERKENSEWIRVLDATWTSRTITTRPSRIHEWKDQMFNWNEWIDFTLLARTLKVFENGIL